MSAAPTASSVGVAARPELSGHVYRAEGGDVYRLQQ